MLRVRIEPAATILPVAAPVEQPAVSAPPTAHIVRDFADPHLELVRLLKSAAEVEHALLVQYLYAAFSIKDAYAIVRGTGGFASSTDLFGVAVQEMQHLKVVNRLLVALRAAPNLLSQSFPYDPDVYPFPFHLERLNRTSLAKYVWTEAPAGVLDPSNPANADDLAFITLVNEALGNVRPNHLGSLYGTIIDLVAEVAEVAAEPGSPLPEPQRWVTQLDRIRVQGEDDHFGFFRSVFLGEHPGFEGKRVWDVAPDHPDFPSEPVPTDPSAYEGHPGEIPDEELRELAMLANLQYWIVLMLLDVSYRRPDDPVLLAQARDHMQGPLFELGTFLAARRAAAPFDPLGTGYAPGLDTDASLAFLRRLLGESQRRASQLGDRLPPLYPTTTDSDTPGPAGPLKGSTARAPRPLHKANPRARWRDHRLRGTYRRVRPGHDARRDALLFLAARPARDHRRPGEDLAAFRDQWTTMSADELDSAFDHDPFPAGVDASNAEELAASGVDVRHDVPPL